MRQILIISLLLAPLSGTVALAGMPPGNPNNNCPQGSHTDVWLCANGSCEAVPLGESDPCAKNSPYKSNPNYKKVTNYNWATFLRQNLKLILRNLAHKLIGG